MNNEKKQYQIISGGGGGGSANIESINDDTIIDDVTFYFPVP